MWIWVSFSHKTLSRRERFGELSVGNLAEAKKITEKLKTVVPIEKNEKNWDDFTKATNCHAYERIIFGFFLSLWHGQLLRQAHKKWYFQEKFEGPIRNKRQP